MLGPNVNECVRYMETMSISVRCFIECGQQVRGHSREGMLNGWEGHSREGVVNGWEGHNGEGVVNGRERWVKLPRQQQDEVKDFFRIL